MPFAVALGILMTFTDPIEEGMVAFHIGGRAFP